MKKVNRNLLTLSSLAFLLFFCGTVMKMTNHNRILTAAETTRLSAGEVCCEDCRPVWSDTVCDSIGSACDTKLGEPNCVGGYVSWYNWELDCWENIPDSGYKNCELILFGDCAYIHTCEWNWYNGCIDGTNNPLQAWIACQVQECL